MNIMIKIIIINLKMFLNENRKNLYIKLIKRIKIRKNYD